MGGLYPGAGYPAVYAIEPPAAGGGADQEPSLIGGKLVGGSLLLSHLVH